MKQVEETRALFTRVFQSPDGRRVLDHLHKVFLPAPTMAHQGLSEQCLFGRAEVVLYCTRNAQFFNV